MRFARDIAGVQSWPRSALISIGNFDGVHRGHQTILKQLAALASPRSGNHHLSGPTTIITFEPHPLEYFRRELAPPRIMTLRQKMESLKDLGIEQLLCLRFNQTLADTSAEEFVARVLVRGLGAGHVVVGDDFRFGHGRSGSFDLLGQMGAQAGFQVTATETCRVAGARVSSSRIRQALATGDIALANHLLGRRFEMQGHVTYGDRIGRSIGVPTANVALHRRSMPLLGIFAVWAQIDNGPARMAAAYVGSRPTVNGVRPVLETHFLDFDDNLYGKRIRVGFVERIRQDHRFANVEMMREQIMIDIEAARTILNRYPAQDSVRQCE